MLTQRIADCAFDRIGPFIPKLRDRLLLAMDNIGVITLSTNEEIVGLTRRILQEAASTTGAPRKSRVASISHQNIVALATDQNVAPSCCDEYSALIRQEEPADQHVVASAPVKDVITRIADDEIIQLVSRCVDGIEEICQGEIFDIRRQRVIEDTLYGVDPTTHCLNDCVVTGDTRAAQKIQIVARQPSQSGRKGGVEHIIT